MSRSVGRRRFAFTSPIQEHLMNMRTISALAVLTLAAGGTIAALPSNAVKIPTSVTKATVTGVAPITCSPEEDACELGFAPNGGNGYIMFRLADAGSIWVRASLVPGWDNTQSPPITCRYSTSCVLDFVNQAGNTDFWRARQASQPNGPWVRLTLVNGN